jgi:predicted RNase H-like nuclease (RuvC/YqgF family)
MTNTDSSRGDEGRGGLVRRVLAGTNPEERLEELLAQRRKELDAHAEQLHASIAELERREELLRDSRASVERMLRLGTSDLEAREQELASYLRELTEREKEIAQAEEELGQRRQELGAVELKRAAVERRERALETREAELAEREAAAPPARGEAEPVELAFVPGARYVLVELDASPLTAGLELEVEDEVFVVTRIGRSPLPGDARRCAYLTRGARGREDSSPGSS